MPLTRKPSPKRLPGTSRARGAPRDAKPLPSPPGTIGSSFDPIQLGNLDNPTDFGPVDRRVLIPLQPDAMTGWERVLKAAATCLSKGPLDGSGVVLAGELPDAFSKLAPPPFFPSRPAALFVSGSPIFVAIFVSRVAKALGAQQVVEQVDALPQLDLLATVSMTHVVLCEEADLRPYADQISKGGLHVTVADLTTFDLGVSLAAQAWIDQVADKPSTEATAEDGVAYRARLKARIASRRAEPGEPQAGDHARVPGLGSGHGVVLRVVRYHGRWTRVIVRVATGCMPVPEFPGQPQDQWAVPASEISIKRSEWEKLQHP